MLLAPSLPPKSFSRCCHRLNWIECQLNLLASVQPAYGQPSPPLRSLRSSHPPTSLSSSAQPISPGEVDVVGKVVVEIGEGDLVLGPDRLPDDDLVDVIKFIPVLVPLKPEEEELPWEGAT